MTLTIRIRQLAVLGLVHSIGLVAAPFAAHGQEKSPTAPPLTKEQLATLMERDALIPKTRQLQADGKLTEAERVIERMMALEKLAFGDEHEEVAGSWSWLATIQEEQGEYPRARQSRAAAVAILAKVHGPKHWRVADERMSLANVDVLAKMTPGQVQLLKQGKESEHQAWSFYTQGKFEEASRSFGKALAIRIEVLGAEHVGSAEGRFNLGLSKNSERKHAEAETLYRDSLAWYRQRVGDDHPRTASIYHVLALNLADQRRFADAESMDRQALEIRRRVFGELNAYTAVSYANLGMSLANQKKDMQAEPFLRKALELRRQLLGEEHKDTISSYVNLAHNLDAQGKRTESAPLHSKVLELRRKLLAKADPDGSASARIHVVSTDGLKLVGLVDPMDAKVAIDRRLLFNSILRLPAKTFQIKLTGGTSYLIDLVSEDFDSYLMIQDPAGKQLAFDDDGGGNLNSRLQVTPLRDGAYTVCAASFKGAGAFTLTVRPVGMAKIWDVTAALKVPGKIRSGGAKAGEAVFVQFHQGKTYLIDMISADQKSLDPVLRLLDVSGKQVAFDDDGGDELNARIVYLAPATATYQIVAASFDANGSGPFTLHIRNDDSRKADALALPLEKRADDLRTTGKWREALEAARAALTVRDGEQGVDHWQTIDARWRVKNLEKLRDLPEAAQKEIAQAEWLARLTIAANRQGKETEAAWRTLLDVRRRHLGEENPTTILCYNNVAFALHAQEKYLEAEPLLRAALQLWRKVVGEDHPELGSIYDNLAASLYFQSKFAEAEPLVRKALQLRRKHLGDFNSSTARNYANLGGHFLAQGKYAEAEPLLQRALELRIELWGENHTETAESFYGVAFNLNAQGKYAEALPILRKVLHLRKTLLGEHHAETATAYGALGANLDSLGMHAEAQTLFAKALAIRRVVLGDDHHAVASSYNSIASSLRDQDKFAEARAFFEKALELRQRVLGSDHLNTLHSLGHLGLNYQNEGDYGAAKLLLTKALAGYREILGENHPDTSAAATALGFNCYARGRYVEAESYWSQANRSFEVARLLSDPSGLGRVAFSAKRSPAVYLAACLARNGKPLAAWQHLESSLARGLLEEVFARLPRGGDGGMEFDRESSLVTAFERLQGRIQKLVPSKDDSVATRLEFDRLLAEQKRVSKELADFRRDRAARAVYSLERIQAQLADDAALLVWVDVWAQRNIHDSDGDHWACVVRHKGLPRWIKLRGSGPSGAWTREDDSLPHRVRTAIANRSGDAKKTDALIAALAKQRFAPVEAALQVDRDLPPVQHLLVHPVGVMAGVPLEIMTDRCTISYVPSGTLFAKLREESTSATPRASRSARRLLAVGDPVFKKRDADAASPVWPSLPGTRTEVTALGKLFADAEVLLGSDASEQRLDELAAEKKLSQFRYLHFATHGVMNPTKGMETALILAQDQLPDPALQVLTGKPCYDGRLTAAKIARHWNLDADLVTLSACQTALGSPGGGEGFVGFSQALFTAGARSVVVSQWPVDDRATALLMVRFYQNLLGQRPGLKSSLTKKEALREAKTWLRTLTRKDAESLRRTRGLEWLDLADVPAGDRPYERPFYWSAFILLGDPE